VHGFCFAVRKQVAGDAGGFDNEFTPLADEIEFCARAREKGWGIYVADRVDYEHEYSISEKTTQDIQFFGRVERREEIDRRNNARKLALPWLGRLSYKE
jgi:GT2 family glycosyltransferase